MRCLGTIVGRGGTGTRTDPQAVSTRGACCTSAGVAPKAPERRPFHTPQTLCAALLQSLSFPDNRAHFGGEVGEGRISFSWKTAAARLFFLLQGKHLARPMQKAGLAEEKLVYDVMLKKPKESMNCDCHFIYTLSI